MSSLYSIRRSARARRSFTRAHKTTKTNCISFTTAKNCKDKEIFYRLIWNTDRNNTLQNIFNQVEPNRFCSYFCPWKFSFSRRGCMSSSIRTLDIAQTCGLNVEYRMCDMKRESVGRFDTSLCSQTASNIFRFFRLASMPCDTV